MAVVAAAWWSEPRHLMLMPTCCGSAKSER
jgi:hypothetical protein